MVCVSAPIRGGSAGLRPCRGASADPPESSRGGGRVCGVSAVDCLKGLAAWRAEERRPETPWDSIYIIASNLAHCRFRIRAENLILLPHLLHGF